MAGLTPRASGRHAFGLPPQAAFAPGPLGPELQRHATPLGWPKPEPDHPAGEGAILRTTENLSLRLDPEVIRLARRAAESNRQTLREFFEQALRRHVAAVTRPEEQANLISTVEEAFLRQLDKRLNDMLERVAALSVKEALDQAQTLQIVKRVLFVQIGDQKKTHLSIDQAWKEAAERVRSRGRQTPPEAVKALEEKLAAAERLTAEQVAQLSEARSEAERVRGEANRLRAQLLDSDTAVQSLRKRVQDLEGRLQREEWVTRQLEAQSGIQFRRKTVAELRDEYSSSLRR